MDLRAVSYTLHLRQYYKVFSSASCYLYTFLRLYREDNVLKYHIPGGMFRVLESKCTKWTVIWGRFVIVYLGVCFVYQNKNVLNGQLYWGRRGYLYPPLPAITLKANLKGPCNLQNFENARSYTRQLKKIPGFKMSQKVHRTNKKISQKKYSQKDKNTI